MLELLQEAVNAGNDENMKNIIKKVVPTFIEKEEANKVIKNGDKVRLIRDGIVIYDGIIASLQRGKDKASEVKKGIECGITIENFNDIKEGDIIEVYTLEEVKR